MGLLLNDGNKISILTWHDKLVMNTMSKNGLQSDLFVIHFIKIQSIFFY